MNSIRFARKNSTPFCSGFYFSGQSVSQEIWLCSHYADKLVFT